MQNVLKIAGLYTSANQLSSVPEGALSTANNVDILYRNIAQPRRGMEKATALGYSDSSYRADKITFFQEYLLSHYGTAYSANTLAYYSSGWNSLGTFSAPTGRKMQFLQANKNLYFTTSTGVKKMTAYNSTPTSAGVPKALNLTVSLTGASGWFEGVATTATVAYRVVWAIKDANNNLILGAPSGRTVVYNTLGAGNNRETSISFYIPDGITTSHFYQIYRSNAAEGVDVLPNDEMQLVYEGYPTPSQISTGQVTGITDVTPDSLKGAALYTNASQEGLVARNEQPPLAKDLASYQDCAFYANTTEKHRYYLTLISASKLQNDDTITIGGVVYTAKASETIASGYFKRFTAGSASQNILDTALSLVNVINGYTSSTVSAEYISTENGLPGQMLLEEIGVGGAAFVITTSRTDAWTPAGILSSGTTETSENDSSVNKLIWSKPFQPEHVPLANYVYVGSANSAIKKIVGLKDYLIIFKEDGIYRLTGTYGNFAVELLDSSAVLIGPETAVILNNQIVALTDIGVVQISEGVQLISEPINQDITEIINSIGSTLETNAFAVAYEVEKKFYLFLQDLTTDATPTFAYVYNLLTQAWTKHLIPATCGAIGAKTLYLGDSNSHYVLKERKNYSFLDYVDFGFDTSITSISGTTLGIASNIDSISVGDSIWQSNTIFGIVQSVSNVDSTVVVDRDPGFTVAACEILNAIPTKVGWSVMVPPDPAVNKQFSTAIVYCDEAFTGTASLGFKTDKAYYEQEVTLTGTANNTWGNNTWGSGVWGTVKLSRNWRTWIPRTHQRGSQIEIFFNQSYAYSPYKLSGVTILGNAGNERVRRD